jgi:nucleoside phosphorylase
MINLFMPKYIMQSGIAGSMDPDLHIGDVAIPQVGQGVGYGQVFCTVVY